MAEQANTTKAKVEAADERRMPFTEHLQELRTRLRYSVMAVMVMTVVAYLFKEPLFALMARPLSVAWVGAQKSGATLQNLEIVFTNLIDPFMVYLKLALMAGVFAASPVIFHQLWKFISPGLYARERRLALPFIVSSVILFFGGAYFAYIYVMPAGYKYFLGYASESMGTMKAILGKEVNINVTDAFSIKPMITIDEYFSLTSTLLLMFGAVFELPLLLSILAMIGIVTPKGLWRFNRYAILIFFILGAVLTPGDLVVGQIAMGGALTVLYNLSIVAAIVVAKRRKKHREAEEAAERERDREEAEAARKKAEGMVKAE
jgi:sec-independent protein translocase protein TatC